MEKKVVKLKNLAENIRFQRKLIKLTQAELAARINVSVKSVSHWETGYSEPSIDQLVTLSNIFEITIDELIF